MIEILINLGSGKDYRENWINCDISKGVNADRYFDVRRGMPFENDFADQIQAGCVLEQIESNDDFLFVMNELWRVLKSTGKLTGYVPNGLHPNVVWLDPMDARFFRKETFNYFDHRENAYKQFGKHYGFLPWEVVELNEADNGIIHFTMIPKK